MIFAFILLTLYKLYKTGKIVFVELLLLVKEGFSKFIAILEIILFTNFSLDNITTTASTITVKFLRLTQSSGQSLKFVFLIVWT